MPNTLHSTINSLASQFAHDLLRALRGASLEEIISETSGGRGGARLTRGGGGPIPFGVKKKGKRIRRSPEDLQKLADHIVSIVMKHAKGMRAEELKRSMGVAPGNVGAKAFTKPLQVALASGKIRKQGTRRATVYLAAK